MFTRLALATLLLSCACSKSPAPRSSPPVVVAERSPIDAGTDAEPAPSAEREAADDFGRCTARPVKLLDVGSRARRLTDTESKLLALADGFVKESGARKDAKLRIPRHLLDAGPAGDAVIDLARAKLLRSTYWFEQGKYVESAIGAHDLVLSHPEHASAHDGYQLLTAVFYILGGRSDPPRPECFAVLRDDLSRLQKSFCNPPRDAVGKGMCDQMARFQADLRVRMNW